MSTDCLRTFQGNAIFFFFQKAVIQCLNHETFSKNLNLGKFPLY